MKALTLWPEWAFAIARLDKRLENRTWAPPRGLIGQRIAIHAGRSIGGRPGAPAREDGLAGLIDTAHSAGWSLIPGAQQEDGSMPVEVDNVGTYDVLYDWLHAESHRCGKPTIYTSAIVALVTVEGVSAPHSVDPWYVGPVAWKLTDVQPLAQPIRGVRGAQGLWGLSDELAEQATLQARSGWPLVVSTSKPPRSPAHGHT